MEVLAILAAVVLAAALIIAADRRIKHNGAAFRATGEAAGLPYMRGGLFSRPGVYGEVRNFRVTVRHAGVFLTERTKRRWRTLIRVYVDHSVPLEGHFTVYSGGLVVRRWGRTQKSTGYDAFDRVHGLYATGSHVLPAVLRSDAMEMVLRLRELTDTYEITRSWFRAYFTRHNAAVLAEAVHLMSGVSAILCRGGDARDLLTENISLEGNYGFRLLCLRELTARFPMDAPMEEFLRRRMEGDSPDLRVAAAGHLSQDGMAYLLRLLDEGSEPSLVPQIVGTLAGFRSAAALPALKKLYATGDPLQRRAVLRAFGTIGDGSVTSFLAEDLAAAAPELRTDLADALGACGTADALEPLLEAAESWRGEGDAWAAAAAAAEKIRERAGKGRDR